MKRKKKVKQEESTAWLYPMDKRIALGKRKPRDIIACPECGEDAERSTSNGKWRCLGTPFTIAVLTCCASGVTLPDGALVTSAQRRKDETLSM